MLKQVLTAKCSLQQFKLTEFRETSCKKINLSKISEEPPFTNLQN